MTQRYRWIRYGLVALVSSSLLTVLGCDGGGTTPVLKLSASALNFTAVEGGGNPEPQTFQVQNDGGGTLKWTATLQEGKTWVTVNPMAGSATKDMPSTVQVSVNVADLAVGQYTAEITVARKGHISQSGKVTVTLTILPEGNHPPVIAEFKAEPSSGNAPLTVTFTWSISDPNGDPLTSTVDFGDGSQPYTKPNSLATETVPHTYSAGGIYTAELTVTDGQGGSVNQSVQITVGGDQRPQIAKPTLNLTTLRFPGGELTVSAEVTDDKGLTRVWAVVTKPDQGTEEIALARTSGSTFAGNWTAPANTRTDGQSQMYSIRIYAKDTANQQSQSDPLVLEVQAMAPPPAGPSF